MKKLLSFIVIMMLCVGALADSGIDWSQYPDGVLENTINELTEMLNEANKEMESRKNENGRNNRPYSIDGIDFDVRFYSYNDNSILIEYDWINTSTKVKAFYHTIAAQAFQNGSELDDWILHFGNINHRDTEKIAPGYGKVSYFYFRLKDDSEITVLMTDLYHQGDMNRGLVFHVSPEDLEPFNGE